MDIRFADSKLEKECNDQRLLQRRHGAKRAKLLAVRLAVLSAAVSLADLLAPQYRGPMRCHELTGDRAGQLSIDLDHPYRLIFVPDQDPLPTRTEGGGLDWNRVTRLLILGIADTHE